MNKWITGLTVAILLCAGQVMAQDKPAPLPPVESVDILQQNQAERSRDQPGNNAPTWRLVKEGENHYTSLPGPEAGVLIQARTQFPGQARATTAGEAWRQYRNGPLTMMGAGLLAAALLGVLALYLLKGPLKTREAPTGRLIERFTPAERITHWSVAISFVLLAVSGLIMLFGKYVLLPVFGYTLFGWLAYLCKNIHNFVGPVFTVSIVAFFILYVRDNLPRKQDVHWLRQLGGMSGKHASSGRFNAGEKIWFWGGLVLLGLVVSASGLFLDMLVPGVVYTRGGMQVAHIVHVVGAALILAGSVGHIYLGTVGMEGAYQGMRTGYVDDTWAREHHDLWYEQVQNGEIPRVRTQSRPGAAPVSKAAKT